MRHLFIINPAAGKQRNKSEIEAQIRAEMDARGEEYAVKVTERPGHAIELVRTEAECGDELRVYACGGDGTLNEVVCGAAGHSNCAISQIACGTGNDFLRFFDGGGDCFKDVASVVNGVEREFDLMNANGRYAINICSTGFDARVAASVHKFSRLPGVSPFAAFTLSAAYNLFKGLCNEYRIKIYGPDGVSKIDGSCALICVASARYYGGGYMPMGDTDPADGILDVLVVGHASRLQVPALLSCYKSGRYEEIAKKGIKVHRLRAVRVEVEAIDGGGVINADGEVIMSNKISIRLAPERMRFFAPESCFASLDRMACARETSAAV